MHQPSLHPLLTPIDGDLGQFVLEPAGVEDVDLSYSEPRAASLR